MTDTHEETADIQEAVGTLVQNLPRPVQEFLFSDARAEIARELTQKYHLHLDQAEEFERLYINMLLGITQPSEFAASLRGAGLTQQTVDGLAADVNSRVFIPLRDAQRADTAKAPPARTVEIPKPAPLSPPTIAYAAPTPPVALPGSTETAPMPAGQVPQPAVPPAPEPSVVAHTIAVPAQPHAGHPGWHPAAAVHVFVPAHGMPAHVAPAPAATVAPAPEPVPARPSVPAFVNPEPGPASGPKPNTPITKEYGADPYREPV